MALTLYITNRKTGNLVDRKGKIIYYSSESFYNDIIERKCCIICGAAPGSKPFSQEHVIPDWIVKTYGTKASFMVLPNDTSIRNNQYTIPCCKDCNSELGVKLEQPISELLKKSYDEVWEALDKDESLYLLLLQWVSLIFFKTHYKDTYLLREKDKRINKGFLADNYNWEPFRSIHAISRIHHSKVITTGNVYGTIIVFPYKNPAGWKQFDYMDNLNSYTTMIQVGETVIFAVLNDAGATGSCYKTFLSKITGALNPIQCRELFARLRYASANLKGGAQIYPSITRKGVKLDQVKPRRIELYTGYKEKESLFRLMRFYLEPLMPPGEPWTQDILNDIENGRAQYILDENGVFVPGSV
jgi:hypothetical protein